MRDPSSYNTVVVLGANAQDETGFLGGRVS